MYLLCNLYRVYTGTRSRASTEPARQKFPCKCLCNEVVPCQSYRCRAELDPFSKASWPGSAPARYQFPCSVNDARDKIRATTETKHVHNYINNACS